MRRLPASLIAAALPSSRHDSSKVKIIDANAAETHMTVSSFKRADKLLGKVKRNTVLRKK